MVKSTERTGLSFDNFLKRDGIYDEVTAKAIKRTLTEQLNDAMETKSITKVEMAKRMATSRSQVDRLRNPDNLCIQFDSLVRAASVIGKRVEIRLIDEQVTAVACARTADRDEVAG
jgi:antitoxin HicB